MWSRNRETMHMQSLTVQFVPQKQNYASPFDGRIPGFRPDWWVDTFAGPSNPNHLPYSFTDEAGQEVARALLRARAGFADFEDAGVSLPSDAISVDFMEVRADLHSPRQGFGTRVVRELERLHLTSTLYAFSEGADEFWGSTGWEFMPRRDRRTSYRPLFVSSMHRALSNADLSRVSRAPKKPFRD
jgi:hypothetical protein